MTVTLLQLSSTNTSYSTYQSSSCNVIAQVRDFRATTESVPLRLVWAVSQYAAVSQTQSHPIATSFSFLSENQLSLSFAPMFTLPPSSPPEVSCYRSCFLDDWFQTGKFSLRRHTNQKSMSPLSTCVVIVHLSFVCSFIHWFVQLMQLLTQFGFYIQSTHVWVRR